MGRRTASRGLTPKGEETTYEYDKVGRRMSVGNSYGTVMLSYNFRNFATKRVDGEGYTSRWFCNRMGNLTSYHPAKNWNNHLTEERTIYKNNKINRRGCSMTKL